MDFEPVIVGFTCNWCSYRAADLAGISRIKYPPNVRLIRLMCSGRVDPTFVLKAFAGGADGVMITGCHPGDCHYMEQNYKAMRRYQMLRRVLDQMGVESGRLKMVWASAAEGMILADEISRFVGEVRLLGPLHWAKWEAYYQNIGEKFSDLATVIADESMAPVKAKKEPWWEPLGEEKQPPKATWRESADQNKEKRA